ncbi:MAG: enoyl-CoA hydratase/isomerase family protein [Pseudomonadota bacterium]
MSEPQAEVLVEPNGATRTVTLNRAAKRNALTTAMLAAVDTALAEAEADRSVHTIVLRGAGTCFSAGRDTKEFDTPGELRDGSLADRQNTFMSVLSRLADGPKPTIAAVHGYAFGAGQALTLACDFVVAERGARFGNPEMVYGFPAAMNLALLARHLGRRMGLEIAITGAPYSAERYFDLGLVNRLAEPGALEAECQAFADQLNALAPWAVTRTKLTFRHAEETDARGGLHLGNELNQLLMLASHTGSVHSGDDEVRKRLAGDLARSGGES